MPITVLLSYDLGASGDYEGLYRWLDDQEARECGSSVALFKYAYDDNMDEADIFSSLRSDISGAVSLKKSSRFYAVCFLEGKTRGRFIIGKRKPPPWVGYGSLDDETMDDLGDII